MLCEYAPRSNNSDMHGVYLVYVNIKTLVRRLHRDVINISQVKSSQSQYNKFHN